MILYIIFCLLISNTYSYKCSIEKTLDSQLRTCVSNSSYVSNHTNKYLNIGYDVLLKEFTEENYYYRINDTIKTCPLNYVFNGITCKADTKVVLSKPKNVVCNIKYLSSIDYKNLPSDICNYFVFGPFDMNDKFEITYVNFWENSAKLDEILRYSKQYVNTESVYGIYVSLGRDPVFWKNILEKNVKMVKEVLENFVKKYGMNGLVLRYVNSTKFVDLVNTLNVDFMININTDELEYVKDFINKAKYVNVLYNKEKNVVKSIEPLYTDLDEMFNNISKSSIEAKKINFAYTLYGKYYEISDENAKNLYKNKNISSVESLHNIKMFSNNDNYIPLNSICNPDTKICTKEDLNQTELPNCVYSVSDNKYNNWMVYKNKITNLIDSNTFYHLNELRYKYNITGIYIDSLDDDINDKCNKNYPEYYFSNTLVRVTHKRNQDIVSKVNSKPKSYFTNLEKNTSETPCLNDVCTKTGFMKYKCNNQKYIKCVKRNNVFYKYIFSCRPGYKFNHSTKKCRKYR